MTLLLATFVASFPGAARAQLRIETVVPAAANLDQPDEDGDYPAYIVIRSLEVGFLSGHYLTDDAGAPTKWQIPEGYVLGSGETIRIFASGKDRRPAGPEGELHTSFTFPCSVPYCGLFDLKASLVDSFSDFTNYCECRGEVLVGGKDIVRTWIPDHDIGLSWTQVSFDDTDWMRGLLGVGYDLGTNPFLENLILHHTMDRDDITGATVLDVSGPTLHPGMIFGSPGNPAGLIEECLSYPIKGDSYVRVDHHNELNPGQDEFSASIWFYPERTLQRGDAEFLLYKGGLSSNNPGWCFYRTSSGTYVQVAGGKDVFAVEMDIAETGEWHHLVMVVDRKKNGLRGYLDGKEGPFKEFPPDFVLDINGEPPLYEGRDGSGEMPFYGSLDDFGIWARALTPEDVERILEMGRRGMPFSDPSLTGGPGLYDPLIGTDVKEPMYRVNPSAYVRVPFHLDTSPALAGGLRLLMLYDDGFVAYLNGVEVARRRAPDPVWWHAAATSDRPDTSALVVESIDLSSYVGLLRQGSNVLAFHGLNSEDDADRFLVYPAQLCMERGSGQPPDGCTKTTNGTDFWLAFPENYEEEPDNPLHIVLNIAGPPGTSGLIEIPGLAWTQLFTVSADGTVRVELPKEVELEGADSIEKKGVHVMASNDVAVYGLNHMAYSTDSYLGLPMTCLGTEYIVLTYQNVHDNVPLLHGTELGIVSPQDDTKVTIIPSETIDSHPGGVPYTITLDRGETYQLRNEAGEPVNMTGTEIFSDKPVGVFGAHRCANIATANQVFCDFIVEELLPVSLWSTTHYVVPLMTRDADTVQVLASRDDTPVMVDGTMMAMLKRGEVYEFRLDNGGPGTPGARVYSEYPIMVMQYSNSADYDGVMLSDPFMCLIQPYGSWLGGYRFRSPPASRFSGNNYINVVAANSTDLNQVRVNGTQVTTLAGAELGGFDNGYVYARAPLPVSITGGYQMTGRGRFSVTMYGFAEFDSYGNPGGMEFPDNAAPVVDCPEEITVRCEWPSQECWVETPDLTRWSEFYDDCVPASRLSIWQEPPPGEPLGIGTYTVELFAADGNGNVGSCKTKLIVKEMWEVEQFGYEVVQDPELEATVWGEAADPDGDGFVNGAEKGTGSDPNDPASPYAWGFEIYVAQDEGGTEYLWVKIRKPILGEGILEGNREPAGWRSGPDIFEEQVEERRILPGGEYEERVYKARETANLAGGRYFVRYLVGD